MRIAKYIAHCGYCSRREAELLITNHKVLVDNTVISDLSFKITNNSQVYINDKLLSLPKTSIWLYNKPKCMIISKTDDKGRVVIFDKLPPQLKNFITVGRLDYNSEGLILLTNNGDLARYLELPANNIRRKYLVRIFGQINIEEFKYQLESGITVDEISYKSITLSMKQRTKNNTWISLTLSEGKNREIRKIISSKGLSISKLIRVEYGKFRLNNIATGSIIQGSEKLTSHYLKKMQDTNRV